LEVLGLILGLWLARGHADVALRGFLCFICYLRPGESILQAWQLVPPTLSSRVWALLLSPLEGGTPGKTNLYDETVLIDNNDWITEILHQLIANRPRSSPLWSHSHFQFVKAFKEALSFWKLEWLGATLYSLRHGGASWDLLHKQRTLPEIKKRGRWASDTSLRRYVKESRLQHQISKLPKELAIFGLKVIANLPQVFSGKQAPLCLPQL
jgi:hypothetical protein